MSTTAQFMTNTKFQLLMQQRQQQQQQQQQQNPAQMFANNLGGIRPGGPMPSNQGMLNANQGATLNPTGAPQQHNLGQPPPNPNPISSQVVDASSVGSRSSSVPVNLPMGPPATQPAIPTSGAAIYKLVQYGEFLAPRPDMDKLDIEQWRKFVNEFYVENGCMKYTIRNIQFKDSRTFELSTALLPRYYVINFESDMTGINLLMSNPREFVLPNNSHIVECSKASFIYHFDNGIQVTANGMMRATFTPQLKIEQLEFHTSQHDEFIPRQLLQSLALQTNDQESKGRLASGGNINLPKTPVNEYGVPPKTMRCLEISEVICHMRELISFSLQSNSGPIQSLQKYAEIARSMRQGSTPVQSPVPSHAIPKQMMEGMTGIPSQSPSAPHKQPIPPSNHNMNSGVPNTRYEPSPSPGVASPRANHAPSPVLGKNRATFAVDLEPHRKKRANSQQGSPKAKKAKAPVGISNKRRSSTSATPSMDPADKEK